MIQNLIAKWREKVWEPGLELFERGRQQWLQLKPRERVILSVLAGVSVSLLAVLFVKTFLGVLLQSDFVARQNMENIERLRAVAEQLIQQRSQMLRYESLRSERPQNLDLQEYVKSKAQEMGVSLDQVSVVKPKADKKNEEGDEFLQITISKSASFNASLQYLDSLHRMLGLRIVELKASSDFANPGQVQMIATVAGRKEL